MDLAKITEQVRTDKQALGIELEALVEKWKKQRVERHAWFIKQFDLDGTTEMSSPEFFAALDVMAEISGNLEDALWMAGFDGETGTGWLNKTDAPSKNRRCDVLRMILHGVIEKYIGDRLDLDIEHFLGVIEDGVQKTVPTTIIVGSSKPSKSNHPSLDTKLGDIQEFSELPTMAWNALMQSGFYYFGDLLVHSETEMRDVRKLGRNGMDSLKFILSNFGCYFGMRDISNEDAEHYRKQRAVRHWFLDRGCLSIKVLVEDKIQDWQDFVDACGQHEVHKFRDLMTASTSSIGSILGDNDHWVTVVTNLVSSQDVPGFKLGMAWPTEIQIANR